MAGKIPTWEKICFAPSRAGDAPTPPPISNLRPKLDNKTLSRRARSKWFSWHIASELANLNSPLKYSYINTLKCGQTIIQKGEKLTSTYCGNRWCLVCSRIRTAKMINKYAPVFAELNEPQLVTLTIRNISIDKGELREVKQKMYAACRKIQDVLRKWDVKLYGIRKFEPIPSKDGKGIHPHFHWIIDGEIEADTLLAIWKRHKLPKPILQNLYALYQRDKINFGRIKGEMLKQLWLKQFPDYVANDKAQDVRSAKEGSLNELFKYTTKIITKTKNGWDIPLQTLDVIYQAVRGSRTVQLTGFGKNEYKHLENLESEKIECDLQAQEFEGLQGIDDVYEWNTDNWYDIVTGQPLVKYEVGRFEARLIESFSYG